VYEILLENRAEKDLKRLPRDVYRRVIRVIDELARVPRPTGSRKLVGFDNDWRVRVGDYRVIYEIVDSQQVVRIMFVRHRKDAYR